MVEFPVVSVVPYLKNLVFTFSIQGRILVAVLALLGVSIATAAPQEIANEKIYESAWRLTEPIRLNAASVSMGSNYANPTYFLRLENGDVIELPPQTTVNVSGLTNREVREASEDARIILEGIAKLILSKQSASYAVVRGNYAVSIVPDQKWLANHNLKTLDPIAAIGDDSPMGAVETDVVLPGDDSTAAVPRQTVRERLRKFYSFIRDAVWVSAIQASRNRKASMAENKDKISEWGYQIAFRGEFQFGVGKRNFTRNFPVMLSFGYNRQNKTLVFRRGYREESVADGVATPGWKVEFRRYRLFADGADAADPRPNYAKLKGTSWYPPSIPIFSPVADSAPGYQSEGFALGSSIQSLFLPQTLWLDVPFALLNTVTSFEETQRVYSAPIPDPAAWMRRFHEQMTSSGVFAGPVAAQRCEALFNPMPTRRSLRRVKGARYS
jgi:hypothetical protein